MVGLVNSSGKLVVEYVYDPWGKLLETKIGVAETDSKYTTYNNMALRNPLRYRGYIYDRDTGLYYLQSRYYDPEIGRFINADSYASTDATGLLSTNMFAYCENDPVNKSDPSGEFWNIVVGAGMEVLTQLATGTKLRDINWVGVAVQGAAGAASSFTIGFKVASKALNLAVNIVKNVGVSTVAETINQNINRSKSKGKTAAVGAQAAIDTLVDRGSAWLVGSTKAKAAKIIVKTVKNTFSFTFGISIETLFSRHHSRYASGR
ncbi:MAG: RHS repeat-associated core domain-containing protein [Firmicutes bacterium]|nr:RHS repeat-associated core domain-containing protein [Bacillota bacterium]